jgi:hypothetical protein
MPITPNTRFVGIENNLVDLVEKKSRILNQQIDTYPISDITSSFRITATDVLLQTGWSLVSGVYQQQLNNTNIQASSYVAVVPDNTDVPIVQAAEVLPQNKSFNGYVMIYSKNEPLSDINVTLNIFI